MLVPNQYFEIRLSGRTIPYYRKLGYDIKNVNDKITVPVEHLSSGSGVIIEAYCDYCGEIFTRRYYRYLISKSDDGLDNCKDCKMHKTKKTILKKYGVEKLMDVPEIREKMKNTMLERYGVEHILDLQEYKDKAKETCLKRYGVEHYSYTQEYIERVKATSLQKYGVENILLLPETREKYKQTCIEKYGVENPSQCSTVVEKRNKTFLKNGTIKTSSQQIHIYDLLKTKYQNIEKNYPCDNSFFDVALFIDNIKIDIEYDGWRWHQDKQKDRRRDEHFKAQGWKILRIRSGHLLPTEEQLFTAIEELITADRKFKEIILDDWREGEESV